MLPDFISLRFGEGDFLRSLYTELHCVMLISCTNYWICVSIEAVSALIPTCPKNLGNKVNKICVSM